MPIGPDPELAADQGDPYLAWARAAQDMAPAVDQAPIQPPAPPLPPPPPGMDPYATWAGGPITSPTPPGPVLSPEQAPAGGPSSPAGPVTMPGEAPATGTAPGGFGGDVNPVDRARAIEAMTPEDRAAAVQSMTPDEFVGYKARRNAAMMLKQSELEHQANLDSERRAREDLEMHRAASAKASADMKDVLTRADAIANTKIDPDRFVGGLRERGHFGLAMVGMALGGLASEQTGGRNLALEQFNKRLENDIAAQHSDIANRWRGVEMRKGAIADEYARTGDMYRAQETYRIAAYQSAINGMQSTLQQLDPAGGSAVLVRDQIDQFHQAQLATANAFGQQQLKNHIDLLESDRKIRETNSVIAKNAAESAKLYAEAGKVGKKETEFDPAELAAIHPGAPVPPIKMSLKDYKAWVETHKAGQEAALAEREYGIGDVRPVKDADGNVVGSKSVPFVNADKKPFRAPSTKEAETLRNQKAGVDTTSQFVDQMISGIKKYGGSSKFFKSPEWVTMQANKESLLFALHQAYGVEGFRPGVLEQMEKALGGQDPSAYAVLQGNAIPGLEAAKKAVVAHFNSNLRSKEYTGPEYSPPEVEGGAEMPKLSGRTAAENAPGPLDQMGRGLQQDAQALVRPLDLPQAGSEPEFGPRVGPTGLSLDDTAAVQDLVKRYEKGTPATKEKVVAALVAPLSAGRPSLNSGVLSLISESPELYRQVFDALPDAEKKAELSNQAGLEVIRKQREGK